MNQRKKHKRIKIQYGDNCTKERKVYEWMERFKGGYISSVHDID
jgi:hypothetical protein